MRVCIRKSDGRIMESQSGDGSLDALIANAKSAGIDADISQMDDAQFAVLLKAQIDAERAEFVETVPNWGKAVIAELASKADASADIKALDVNQGVRSVRGVG